MNGNGKKRKRLTKYRRFRLKSLFRNGRHITALMILVLPIAVIILVAGTTPPVIQSQVMASDSRDRLSSTSWQVQEERELPPGIAGLVYSLDHYPTSGAGKARMGTSAETVLVGQRIQQESGHSPSFDCSKAVNNYVENLSHRTVSRSASASMMRDYDYENLCDIVEAEAGTEDLKGRILVANVIINRTHYHEFPDTISDVIFHYDHGVAQFSPVMDGSIYDVVVTDLTREAVRMALEGTDYSQGALFFIQKEAADKQSVRWFEKNLKKLFKHGVHEFYTYPDDVL